MARARSGSQFPRPVSRLLPCGSVLATWRRGAGCDCPRSLDVRSETDGRSVQTSLIRNHRFISKSVATRRDRPLLSVQADAPAVLGEIQRPSLYYNSICLKLSLPLRGFKCKGFSYLCLGPGDLLTIPY